MTTDVQPETTTADLPPDALACIDCGVPVLLDAVSAKPIVVTTTKALARTVVDVTVLRCQRSLKVDPLRVSEC